MLERRAELGDLALFVNTADDPVVERIVTPRVALTVAEHLAFDLGRHVLVVLADLTNYCEAVRQVSAARGEVPSRRGYPGYLYSDLASLLERAGRIKGVPGSLTQLPVLTMPAGDITHPVPDVTGYITEGQLVLSAEAYARGVSPPLDPLASLSRLMRHGAGPGLTRDDHLEIAAQLYGIAARARQVADLAEVVGEDALAESDRDYLRVAAAFESDFLSQPLDESRSLEETLDRAWAVASLLPRDELSMITPATLDAHYRPPRCRCGSLRVERAGSGSCGGWTIARRGADLLDRKRQVLLRELARVRTEAADARLAWHDAVAQVALWIGAGGDARRPRPAGAAGAPRPGNPPRSSCRGRT